MKHQKNLIIPIALTLFLGFIFACQKEATEHIALSTNDLIETEPVNDRGIDPGDITPVESPCCSLKYLSHGLEGGTNHFITKFYINVLESNWYYFEVQRKSDGAKFKTDIIIPFDPYDDCMNTKVVMNMEKAVIYYFGDCMDEYRTICHIVSEGSSCNRTAYSPYFKLGKIDCTIQ